MNQRPVDRARKILAAASEKAAARALESKAVNQYLQDITLAAVEGKTRMRFPYHPDFPASGLRRLGFEVDDVSPSPSLDELGDVLRRHLVDLTYSLSYVPSDKSGDLWKVVTPQDVARLYTRRQLAEFAERLAASIKELFGRIAPTGYSQVAKDLKAVEAAVKKLEAAQLREIEVEWRTVKTEALSLQRDAGSLGVDARFLAWLSSPKGRRALGSITNAIDSFARHGIDHATLVTDGDSEESPFMLVSKERTEPVGLLPAFPGPIKALAVALRALGYDVEPRGRGGTRVQIAWA